MKILALDSSGIVASVAVVEDDTLLAEYTVNYKKTHSQTLLPMLDEIVKMTELELESVDAIAVAAGPGSFTGLRIGSATAKGLGLALKKPLVAVPTVDALAYNLYDAQGLICPIMDARRKQVYTGIYRFEEHQLMTLKEQWAAPIEELLEELNALVGLKQVKEKVHDLIVYQQVQKMRREKNLHSAKNTLHLAFTGNPGTGKTTVARIVGRIYKKIGLLSKGHFVEVSRTDLIAGYQGQTALKVKKVIEQAKGGVLFIDEAYSITENENSDSYGRECLTELTKALEDYREDLVVIVAGYTEPMRNFFESNPGLKSRFNTFIEFPDYNADELDQILCSICRKNDYVLESDASAVICEYLKKCVEEKGENFANGRLARNLYDDLVMNHARRVIKITQPTKEDLCTIVKDDFQPENQKVK